MPSLQNRRVCVVALCVGTLASHAAQAAEPTNSARDASGSATAQVLFDDAIRDMGQGQADAACPKFKRSFELDPKSSALGNLGVCYETLGKFGSAWATYQELSAFARTRGRSEWAIRAEERIAALTPKMIRLVLRVADESPKGFQLMKDGTATTRDEWRIPLVVDPGLHKFDASAPAFASWHGEIQCSEEGKTYFVDVPRLAKAPELPTPKVPTPPVRIAGYVALGVGGASLIVGGVLGLMAKSTYDTIKVEGGCTDVDATSASCSNLTDEVAKQRTSAGTLATGSTLAFVGGALMVAAGITLVVVSKDKMVPKLSLVPNAERGGGGILAVGAF